MIIDPPAHAWRDMLAGFLRSRTPDQRAQAAQFRRQCALPEGAPIIMTGHQPELWHPGVLAKFLVARASAQSLGAHEAWIVPDQDEADPALLRVPVLDRAGRLHVEALRLAPPPPTGAAIGAAPPLSVQAQQVDSAALPSVTRGIEGVVAALRAHENEPTAARQTLGALRDLLAPYVPATPTLFATDLHATDLFAHFLERMLADPGAMIDAYNAGVAAHPDAGITRLVANAEKNRFELPLWRIRAGEPRRRVYAHEALGIPRSELAPRALLMTAMVRTAGCDLFIHGTGGAAYDRVTEHWIEQWLGETLAPSVSVTATLTLPLRDETPDEKDVRGAVWRAHRARHDPAMLADHDTAAQKQALVERISASKAAGADPAPEFRELHDMLGAWRRERAGDLAVLRERAESLRARLDERDIVLDRTWPFPWFEESALRALQRAVEGSFSGRLARQL